MSLPLIILNIVALFLGLFLGAMSYVEARKAGFWNWLGLATATASGLSLAAFALTYLG